MIKSFFNFFSHIHLQGAECGLISAVILSFFRRSSTFSLTDKLWLVSIKLT
jgi:hypothetical protein